QPPRSPLPPLAVNTTRRAPLAGGPSGAEDPPGDDLRPTPAPFLQRPNRVLPHRPVAHGRRVVPG
ncbi:MAG TPA: hypothetical protein VE173_11960, partial [Longimicrobiales bacterium]|nr:hypothetical protein [Longimicrobiales bacterium]